MTAPRRDPLLADPAHVRRRDRAVEDVAWIERLLATATVGALATVEGDQPFLNVNLFWYDAERRAVYVHTARRGRTRANVEDGGPGAGAGPADADADATPTTPARACFAVHEMGRLLPADTALEFSVEYAGVVAFGPIVVVEDDAEAAAALQALLDKYAPHLRPGRDYRGVVPEELARTTVLRLDVERWSGKRKVVPSGFPGAFAVAAPSLLEADRAARDAEAVASAPAPGDG